MSTPNAPKNFEWFERKGSAHPWLPEQTIYLTRHGSHAYGTNTPESDLDLRGIAIPPREYLLGFRESFEQATPYTRDEDAEDGAGPDVVIFGLHKFFRMAANSNPNALEIIFTDPSDHLVVTPLAERLIENRKLFLSRRIRHTLAGYAKSQLGRINRHYRWLRDPPKAPPVRADFGLGPKPEIKKDQLAAVFSAIQKKLDSWSIDFIDHFAPGVRIALVNKMSDYLAEIEIGAAEHFGSAARLLGFEENFIQMLQKERAFKAKSEEWKSFLKWKEKRNPKRAALEAKFGYDTKHGMRLVQLYNTCEEALTTGDLLVRRRDAEKLLEIRGGSWSFDYMIGWAADQEARLDDLMKSSPLPWEVDYAKLDALCIEMVEEVLR